MLDYDNNKIRYTNLKEAVMAANESGILATNIRHVAVKGPKLYETFLETIESLPREKQVELPDAAANFYDLAMFSDEEDGEPLLSELNFGDDSISIPEQIGDDEIVDEAENEMEATEQWNELEKQDNNENTDEKPEVKELNLEQVQPKKMQRLSKNTMTVTVVNKVLSIEFKELDVSKKFKLPEPENIEEYKPVRKKALKFAKDNGATNGQQSAISKTLNIAGYYIR